MAGRIRITSGDDAGRVIEVSGDLVLGRSQEGPGRIPDPEASRSHARVYLDPDGGLAIEDLGSTNGTFVSGTRTAEPRALSPGDTLRVGQTTLQVEPPEPPPAAAPDPSTAELGQVEGQIRPKDGPVDAPAPNRLPRPLLAVLAGVLLLAALGIGAVVLFTGDDDEPKKASETRVEGPPALVSAARAAGCTAQDHPPEGREHVRGVVEYRTNPPNSGNHDPDAAADGAYDVSPPAAQLVHSLEHGRIVMWHKPDDRRAREMLRRVGDEDGSKMILVPNTTGMRYAAAATAWGHLLGCPTLNDEVPDAVRAFRDAYRGKGPELVP
jgi:hypothetical protein